MCARVCVCVWIRRNSFIAFVMDKNPNGNEQGSERKRKQPDPEDKDNELYQRGGKGMGAPKNRRPRSPSPDTASALSKTTLSLEQLGFATYSEIQSICAEADLTATESARVKHAIWIRTWGSRLGSSDLYEY